jgi:hypothetical protein
MTLYTSLFDPRGGSFDAHDGCVLAHRCEVCHETLDDDNENPVCADCTRLDEEGNEP